MLLHDSPTAPSPRRVRIFAAEKGIDLPRRTVDLRGGEHLSDAFRALNPACTVPVLVLDDGTPVSETVAICEYLEGMHPEPPLMGGDVREKAIVAMWQRRIELDGLFAVMEAFRNSAAGFKDRALTGPREVAQIAELGERGRRRYGWFLEDLDARLGESAYVAGPAYTIADITALVTVDFARRALSRDIPADMENLGRWYREVSSRPSASA